MADSPGTRDDLSRLGINVSRNRGCRSNPAPFSNGRCEVHRCRIAAIGNLNWIETISNQSQANMGKPFYRRLVALGGQRTCLMGTTGNPIGHDHLNSIAQSVGCSTCRLGRPTDFSRSNAWHKTKCADFSWTGLRVCWVIGFDRTIFDGNRCHSP